MNIIVQETQFSIKITEDNLYVYLQLHKLNEPDIKKLSSEVILEKIKSLNINFGLKIEVIDKSLDDFYADSRLPAPTPILIARGIDPLHKQSRGIHWFIHPQRKHEYERVVAPDTLIAETHTIDEMQPGNNIFGVTIEAEEKKDEVIAVDSGVYQKTFKDDKKRIQTRYYSSYLGVVYLINKKLRVRPIISAGSPAVTAKIELYSFLGDEECSKINAFHVMETLRRLEMIKGWNALLVIDALAKSRRKTFTELERKQADTQFILSSFKPVDTEVEPIQWKVDPKADKEAHRVILPGQTIASSKIISEGKSGIDIYGNILEPKIKGALIYKTGHGVKLLKENSFNKYRAELLGIIQLIEDKISIDDLISVSSDRLSAYLHFPTVLLEHLKNISIIHIQKSMEVQKIVYGITIDEIKKALESYKKSQLKPDDENLFHKLIVAKGKPPVDGIDAGIDLNQEASTGKKIKGGRIDFKERSYPWNVKEGDVIGQYIEITPPVHGIDVYGNAISAVMPKDIDLILDGIIKKTDGTLIAERDGTLIVTKYHLQVTDVLVLNGDVDNVTGNIHTDSTVIVKGYVEPGFSIDTKADIVINANIEKANAHALGNIVIRGGVRGQISEINAGGEVNVSFMEHAKVNSKCSITIKESIVDCNLKAAENIIIGENQSKNASIVGGITHAYQNIEAGNLGNDKSIKTLVSIGFIEKDMDEYEALSSELTKNKKELEHIEAMYTSGAASSNNFTQMMEKLEPLGLLVEEQEKQLSLLEKIITTAKQGTITVYNIVWPGVTITICGKKMVINNPLKNVVFSLHDDRVVFRDL